MEKIKISLKKGDKKGNTKKLEDALMQMAQSQKKKPRVLALHYTPKTVRVNFEEIYETLKEDVNAPKEMLDLYCDVVVLLRMAEEKFPIVKPPKEEKNEKVS